MINVDSLPVNTENHRVYMVWERTTCVQSTWDWRRTAHRTNNLHHQRYQGYCVWCPNERQRAYEQRDLEF